MIIVIYLSSVMKQSKIFRVVMIFNITCDTRKLRSDIEFNFGYSPRKLLVPTLCSNYDFKGPQKYHHLPVEIGMFGINSLATTST